MPLSHKTSIRISQEYSNIIGHMCYAASKLWNVCNYERHHYKELGLEKYPDWYYQKKVHKGDLWYKQLPSQTAQETCKQLDKAWKSFYVLKKTGGIKEPNPPRFKQGNIPVTYMQMGIRHEKGSDQLRLSLPKDLKCYMEETYGIHEKFLYLENKIFRDMDHIKQLRIYPPKNGKCDLIVIYEIEEPEQLSQNGHYLSIDLGLHNLMTCYDSGNGRTFILGRKYLSLERYQTVDKLGVGYYAQHHFSFKTSFLFIFFKINKNLAVFQPRFSRIFASFFKFMHAKVSPAFISIRAFPTYCVYRNPCCSFAVPNILSMVSFLN